MVLPVAAANPRACVDRALAHRGPTVMGATHADAMQLPPRGRRDWCIGVPA
jgi:hypothetical protein